jgi:uncharacterized protein
MSGEPSYLELGVPDVAAARAFYGALLGWEPQAMGGGASVATPTLGIGIHGGDDERHFEVFFAVPDLDAAMGQVVSLGGALIGDVHDSEGFGRWVECRDDQGVRFGLRQAVDPGTRGH